MFSSFQRIIVVKKRQYGMQTRGDRIRKVGGLKGLYLHYCYLLGYLPRYTKRPAKVSPLLRDDLIKMDRIAEETRMLCRENITTMEELRERIASPARPLSRKHLRGARFIRGQDVKSRGRKTEPAKAGFCDKQRA